eukprot:NODE_757_length_4169_cov_0.564619.p1 type:complete len:243 gc:universal NODE_757_length_4169_cov_0.564619:1797-1069(-)
MKFSHSQISLENAFGYAVSGTTICANNHNYELFCMDINDKNNEWKKVEAPGEVHHFAMDLQGTRICISNNKRQIWCKNEYASTNNWFQNEGVKNIELDQFYLANNGNVIAGVTNYQFAIYNMLNGKLKTLKSEQNVGSSTMTSDGRYCLSIYKMNDDLVNYSVQFDFGKGLKKLRSVKQMSQIQLVGDNLFGITSSGYIYIWNRQHHTWVRTGVDTQFDNFYITEGKDSTTYTIYGNERITK